MRIDIAVKDESELSAIAAFLTRAHIQKVNITHTRKEVSPVHIAKLLKEQCPDLDIMVYLSTKYYHSGTVSEGRLQFRKAFEELKRSGITSVLVVSGHPRTDFDTVEALQELYDHRIAKGMDIYCVFNPYFDPGRLREEQERFVQKGGFSFIKGVFFQVGMDVGKLEKGIEYVQSVRSDLTLFASVPVPGKKTRALLKDASLYGVFLPNSYLLDDELAQEMTQEYLKTCAASSVEPVVYAPEIEEFEEFKQLFS